MKPCGSGAGIGEAGARRLVWLVDCAYATGVRVGEWLVRGRNGKPVRVRCSNLEELIRKAGYADSTAAKYAECVARFLTSYGRRDQAPGPDDLRRFFREVRAAVAGNASQRLHLSAIRAVMDKIMGFNVTAGVAYAPRPAPTAPADQEHVRALSEEVETPRELLTMRLLNVERLRPGQIRDLEYEDIGESHLWLTVRRGRNVWRRPRKLSAETRALLERWFDLARRSASSDDSCAPKPLGLSVRGIEKMLERLADRAGLRTTCTALRKCSYQLGHDVTR